MRNLKAIGWDLNGTVIDDAHVNLIAVNALIRATGGREMTLEECQETFDVPLSAFYAARGCDVDQLITELDAYHTTYEHHAALIQVQPFVVEILKILRARGVYVVIISNNTREGVQLYLDRFCLAEYFSDMLVNENGTNVLHRKTKGERMLTLLDRFQPDEIAIIGDTIEEIEIGSELGITSITIVSGVQARHRLERAGPTLLLDTFEPLLAMLR